MRGYLPAIVGAVALAILSAASVAHASLLPPFFINSVVALGSTQPVMIAGLPPHVEWRTVGTGFFYGYLAKDDPEPTKRQYSVVLVTARHVVAEAIKANQDLSVRVNPKDSGSQGREFVIPNRPADSSGTWFCHPNAAIDIAAVPVNFDFLKGQDIEPNFFPSDMAVANRDKLTELGVTAGDGIFVLGFPMNLAGAQRNYVIVRQGAIARISEMLDRASNTFLIDAFVFPGNSGGPVVLKPEITSIAGTKSQSAAHLIGLVVDYRSYVDAALSQQTGRPRVTFEENSGLAEVLPVDFIDETIKHARDHDGVGAICVPHQEPLRSPNRP